MEGRCDAYTLLDTRELCSKVCCVIFDEFVRLGMNSTIRISNLTEMPLGFQIRVG